MRRARLVLFLMVSLLTINSTFASTCMDAHQERAIRKAEKVWSGKNVDFYYSLSDHGFKAVGGFWLALGVGFAPSLAVSFPVVIGGTIVAGGAILTKSIIDSIQEPRYALINQMIRQEQGLPTVDFKNSKLFRKVLSKAQNVKGDVTADELVGAFTSGMQNSEFCEGDKPFTYRRMEKTVLANLKP